MEFLISIFNSLPSPLKYLLFILFFLFVVGYIKNKTNSSYSILDRAWSLILGTKGFKNKKISSFHEEMHDIDKFNLIYNLKAKNIDEIVHFRQWIKEKNYDIRDISKLGFFFKISNLSIEKPNKFGTLLIFITIIPLLTIGLLSFFPVFSFGAITPLGDNEPWIIINESRAKSFDSDFALRKEDCSFEKISRDRIIYRTKFSPSTLEQICETFNNEESLRTIKALHSLEKIFSIFGLTCLYAGYGFCREFQRRVNALNFYNQHIDNKLS